MAFNIEIKSLIFLNDACNLAGGIECYFEDIRKPFEL
jgi:hypothetical protein